MLSDVLQARIREYAPANAIEQENMLAELMQHYVNPPRGSSFETSYLSFPTTAPITTQTLSSGFGTKVHALLCRRYIKGRDWSDFLWYVARRTVPDLALLGNALVQQGPWQGERFEVSSEWLLHALRGKIESVDWKLARDDVRRFLPLSEQRGLDSWTADLFLHQVERMAAYLAS